MRGCFNMEYGKMQNNNDPKMLAARRKLNKINKWASIILIVLFVFSTLDIVQTFINYFTGKHLIGNAELLFRSIALDIFYAVVLYCKNRRFGWGFGNNK